MIMAFTIAVAIVIVLLVKGQDRMAASDLLKYYPAPAIVHYIMPSSARGRTEISLSSTIWL